MKKICYRCKEEKDISLFKKDAKSKDGHCYRCKACCSVADPELKKLKESKELLLAKGRKICSRCNGEKSIEEFLLKSNGKYHSWCNDCRKSKKKEWDENHVEHKAKYRQDNKERIDKKNAEYNITHYEQRKEKWTIDNERLKEQRKIDRLKPENREKEKARGRKWRSENRERYNKYFHDYYEKDESKKIGRNLRNRLRKVLRGLSSALNINNLTGCSLDFLKEHLASQFTKGMLWRNYGKWHVDHILPCNAFDFNNPIHQRSCFYWQNLRPMWGRPNIQKGSKYEQKDFDKYMKWFMENVINK